MRHKIALSLLLILPFSLLAPRVVAAEIVIEGTVTLPAIKEPPTSGGEGVSRPEAPVAAVFLEGQFSLANPPQASMSQKGKQFSPRLLIVSKGTTVMFPNMDDEYHNVFSYSKAKRFDLGRYKSGETPATQTFDQVGVIKLYCEIHRHMRGTILVVDTPYFVKTDESGKFRLKVPDTVQGQFKLKVYTEDGKLQEQMVSLKKGASVKVNFAA